MPDTNIAMRPNILVKVRKPVSLAENLMLTQLMNTMKTMKEEKIEGEKRILEQFHGNGRTLRQDF